jgi:ABC-type Fe3+-hydroxamate transport system substrate-binding protein
VTVALAYFAVNKLMPQFLDQLNRTIEIPLSPQRIVSLVPSQTELLFDLGLDERVTGITKFCIHPEHWFRNKTRIGGTKNLNLALIESINPDLIIANKEENEREQIELLSKKFPVWISDVETLEDCIDMITDIGRITSTEEKALQITDEIRGAFIQLQQHQKAQNRRAAYLIWKDPYMAAGKNTFINDMMERCGFINVMKDKERYPAVTLQELKELECEYILLSSEPYPFKEKHIDIFNNEIPGSTNLLVDGEFFSWYGSRTRLAPAYFMQLRKQLKL